MDFDSFIATLSVSPEIAADIIKETMDKYKPLVYAVLEELLEIYKDYNANDEFFCERAKSKKQMFDAYCNAGFTREEAMRFILNSGSEKYNTIGQITSILKTDFDR